MRQEAGLDSPTLVRSGRFLGNGNVAHHAAVDEDKPGMTHLASARPEPLPTLQNPEDRLCPSDRLCATHEPCH